MTEDQEKQFNLHGCVSRSIIKAAEVGESQKRITKENHKRGRESQKGTFYFTTGMSQVRVPGCHEHRKHLEVGLFTTS